MSERETGVQPDHPDAPGLQSERPSKAKGPLSRFLDALLWITVIGVLFFAFIPRKSGPALGPAVSISALPLVGATGETRSIPGELKRPLLIEAFASWCGACRRQSGLMSDLASAQDQGQLDVIAVSVDQNVQKALHAKKSWPIPVDVVHDARGEFSQKYRVEVLPTYILVGTDGLVKRVTAGVAGASDIRAWLKEHEN
jgi:thiol-disulfide isomerase/thioredoxin